MCLCLQILFHIPVSSFSDVCKVLENLTTIFFVVSMSVEVRSEISRHVVWFTFELGTWKFCGIYAIDDMKCHGAIHLGISPTPALTGDTVNANVIECLMLIKPVNCWLATSWAWRVLERNKTHFVVVLCESTIIQCCTYFKCWVLYVGNSVLYLLQVLSALRRFVSLFDF